MKWKKQKNLSKKTHSEQLIILQNFAFAKTYRQRTNVVVAASAASNSTGVTGK